METIKRSFVDLQSRKTDKERSLYILVMQRLGMGDYTDFAIQRLGSINHIVLPAEENEFIQPKNLKSNYIDGLLDPVRLNKKTLIEQKILFGDRYTSEFLQIAKPSTEDLMYPTITEQDFNVDEVLSRSVVNVSACDLKDEGGDSYATMYSALCFESKRIYIIDVIYNTKSRAENQLKYINNFNKYKCYINFVESNGQVGYIKSELIPNVIGIKMLHQSSNKIQRIKNYSEMMQFFVFNKKNNSTEYRNAVTHLSTFPRNCKSKDDGIEDVFSYLAEFYQKNYLNILLNNND
jgi:hypothetical protein